jgi:hypothetical protein
MRCSQPLPFSSASRCARLATCARAAGVAAALAFAAGCSILPVAQPDPTRYYVLSPVANATPSAEASPTIVLRPVELASYLRSRPMLVRRGGNEIEFREYARWGEPLELGITRVLREELLAKGPAVVLGGARASSAHHDLELNVRVLACEGAANGEVLFRAVWELAKAGEKHETIARGDYRASGLQWDGKSETMLAERLSEAIAGLAGEIAGALKK